MESGEMEEFMGTYKNVKDLAYAKGSLITDKTFLTSSGVQSQLTGELQAMLRKYQKKGANCSFPVSIFWDTSKDADVAFTDASVCYINAGNEMIKKQKSRVRKWQVLKGLGKHELGHRLYTDMNYLCSILENMKKGILLPSPTLPYEELQNILAKKKHNHAMCFLYQQISNALEDGYIEYRLLEDFPHPNHRNDLEVVRDYHYNELPTLKKCIANEKKETDKLFSILNILLAYCKYGYLKCEKSEFSDERIQVVTQCIPYVDDCNNIWDNEGHYTAVANVIAVLQNYIVKYLENCDEENMSEEDVMNAMQNSISKQLQSQSGSSQSGSSDSSQSSQNGSAPSPLAPQPQAGDPHHSQTQKQQSQTATSGSDSENDTEDTSLETESSNTTSDDGNGNDTTPGFASATTNKNTDSSSSSMEETPRMEFGEKTVISTALCKNGSISHSEISSEEAEKNAKTLKNETQRLLQEMATQAAEKELEKEHAMQIKEFDRNIDYGNIHRGVSSDIRRQVEIKEQQKEDYKELASGYLHISKLLNKKFLKELKEMSEEELMKGLYYGQRFHTPAISRTDKKYFASKRLPDIPSMSVGLVIDESGSMGGKRIAAARIMAIIVEDFCRNAGVKFSCIGHSTPGSNVQLNVYADFKSVDHNDRYRLMNIAPHGANRDGYALKFMLENIKKEESEVKLLIMLSDGQPNDTGYHGTAAYDDLRHLKAECKRNKIVLLAAAIGDDKEVIKGIYGDGFLNISDLDKLPTEMLKQIKKYLR